MIPAPSAARSLDLLRERAAEGRNPFNGAAPRPVIQALLAAMDGAESEAWGERFVDAARVARAAAADEGDPDLRRQGLLAAYDLAHIGRYPAVDSDPKARAYELAREILLDVAPLLEPVVARRIVASGDGDVPVLVRSNEAVPRNVVLLIGGIDFWKEEAILSVAETHLAAGPCTVVAVDGPGTGESPVRFSPSADASLVAVVDWIRDPEGLGAERVVVHGISMGGYWATRLAHVVPGKLLGSVDHAGPAHHLFTTAWLDAVDRDGNYPFGFARTVGIAMGASTGDEIVTRLADASLLDAGVLDRDHCAMLVVNGTRDLTVPFDDMLLVLLHGGPKDARFMEGADHMGFSGGAAGIVAEWTRTRFARA